MAIQVDRRPTSTRVVSRPSTIATLASEDRVGEFGLNTAFWNRFCQGYWRKRGVVLRQAFPRPLVTVDEAFEALVSAGDQRRSGSRVSPISFWIENGVVQADLGLYLPMQTDTSLTTYVERVTSRIQGQRFGLVSEDAQGDDARLWLRLREFLKNFYAVAGWPGEKAKASIFLGNYRHTPFGVHRDRSCVFNFVVHGRKRILAWPPTFFDGKADMTNRVDYDRYREEAIVFEGEPGDLFYLPAGYWHIGEDAGGLSMSVTLALFMEPNLSPSLLDLTTSFVRRHVEVANQLAGKALRAGQRHPSPAAIATIAKGARQTLQSVNRDPELDRTLAAFWLDHVTGSAFKEVPPPIAGRDLPPNAVLRADPDYPVMWIAKSATGLIASASGHAFLLPKSAGLEDVLRRINSGVPFTISELEERYSHGARAEKRASPALVRDLVWKLWTLRAIT